MSSVLQAHIYFCYFKLYLAAVLRLFRRLTGEVLEKLTSATVPSCYSTASSTERSRASMASRAAGLRSIVSSAVWPYEQLTHARIHGTDERSRCDRCDRRRPPWRPPEFCFSRKQAHRPVLDETNARAALAELQELVHVTGSTYGARHRRHRRSWRTAELRFSGGGS